MKFLITLHNTNGVTLADASYPSAPSHLPVVGDRITFKAEDSTFKVAKVTERMFRLGSIGDTEQVILTVDFQ